MLAALGHYHVIVNIYTELARFYVTFFFNLKHSQGPEELDLRGVLRVGPHLGAANAHLHNT